MTRYGKPIKYLDLCGRGGDDINMNRDNNVVILGLDIIK